MIIAKINQKEKIIDMYKEKIIDIHNVISIRGNKMVKQFIKVKGDKNGCR